MLSTLNIHDASRSREKTTHGARGISFLRLFSSLSFSASQCVCVLAYFSGDKYSETHVVIGVLWGKIENEGFAFLIYINIVGIMRKKKEGTSEARGKYSYLCIFVLMFNYLYSFNLSLFEYRRLLTAVELHKGVIQI